ncbi:hypothetical protein K8R33_02995 [archaeon]|nr:hypothetical protein [archaeon]
MSRLRLTERILDGNEVLMMIEGGPDVIEVYQRFLPGQFYVRSFEIRSDIPTTNIMKAHLEILRGWGLDVEKGDAEFGYKMPLPEKGVNYRDLIIFKRW